MIFYYPFYIFIFVFALFSFALPFLIRDKKTRKSLVRLGILATMLVTSTIGLLSFFFLLLFLSLPPLKVALYTLGTSLAVSIASFFTCIKFRLLIIPFIQKNQSLFIPLYVFFFLVFTLSPILLYNEIHLSKGLGVILLTGLSGALLALLTFFTKYIQFLPFIALLAIMFLSLLTTYQIAGISQAPKLVQIITLGSILLMIVVSVALWVGERHKRAKVSR